MSLTAEGFKKATEAWDNMKERLVRLIGFNPATCNHYGIIQLYNKRIDAETSDDTIREIAAAFLRWREDILAICKEARPLFALPQMRRLFRADAMYGTLYFLGIPVDIDEEAERYRPAIFSYLKSTVSPWDDIL